MTFRRQLSLLFLLLLNKKAKKSNEPEKLLSQDNMFSNNVKTMCVLLCPTRILARYQAYHVTYQLKIEFAAGQPIGRPDILNPVQ